MTNHELLADFFDDAHIYGAASPQFRNAKILRVIDGDTIETAIEVASKEEFGSVLTLTTSARLFGINSPDTKPDGAERTKAASENLKKLVAANCKDGQFQAELKGRDKYGRVLCRIISNGVDLNQKMIDDGYAKVYLP